ncbi:hypothetical protein JVT61DRAFT_10804 [Boletus reticuloceps]|uniref:Uncharacterized protein n=1 Tax=Boletus reticuloceps TaxID=495285 RepID=A0A8I2YFI2_9AGAM|nr:hypothetical protein JVT61DRAFT_10804 [Boletus reticuloceps]
MIGWRLGRTEVACPDPHRKSSLRIIRTWVTSECLNDRSTIPLPPGRETRRKGMGVE